MKTKEMETLRYELLKLERHFSGDIATLADEVFHKAEGEAIGNQSISPVEDLAERGFDVTVHPFMAKLAQL